MKLIAIDTEQLLFLRANETIISDATVNNDDENEIEFSLIVKRFVVVESTTLILRESVYILETFFFFIFYDCSELKEKTCSV